jgi:transglutaminase-like putative cysteine protease
MPANLGSARSWQLPTAAVFATMASAVGLTRLIHSGTWVFTLLLIALVIAGAGIGLRMLNIPRPLVVLGQAIALLVLLTALFAHDAAIGGIVPGPGALRELADRVNQGGHELQQYSVPTPDTPNITALIAVCGGMFAFAIDVIAVSCRRPVIAGAPILAVYLIPATRQPGGFSWLAFACAAAGYLALVGTDGHERLGQWGRAVHQRNGRTAIAGATNSGLTRQIATWSILAALFVPLLVPATPQLFHISAGSGGGGSGSGTIYLDQNVDIARDLQSPSANPLFQYHTDAASPLREYFQQEVLTQFNGTEWDPANTAVPAGPGSVTVPGLTNPAVERTTVHVSVNVNGDFGFSTAPSPYATTDVTGLPKVAIDQNTLTVYVNDGGSKPRKGVRYATVGSLISPSAAQLQDATVGNDPIAKSYLSLPSSVARVLKSDAEQITAGDVTPYQQALALQDYFLANFKYSLTPKISGTGVSAIESFLRTKQGFCQQFAATMAAMARALGIPAVVAIGYTPGQQVSDGTFQITTHDAHAWPLLYFDGIGWVQFEPTPSIVSTGRAAVQPWTVAQAQASATAGATVAAPTAAAPTGSASSNKCSNGTSPSLHHVAEADQPSGNCGGQSTNAAGGPAPFASWGPFGVIPRTFESWFMSGNPVQIAVKLLLLLLILLAATPGAARLLRRRKRGKLLRAAASGRGKPKAANRRTAAGVAAESNGASGGGGGGGGIATLVAPSAVSTAVRRELAFAAWEELREYARDLGYGWPESDTPRQLAGRLTAAADFDAESEAAVGRVTTLVERAVYSPDPHIEDDEARALPADVSRVRTALGTAAGRGARLRAAVLPSSSLDQIRLPWHHKRH